MSFAIKAIKYFNALAVHRSRLKGVDFINPYSNEAVKNVVRKFYKNFYDDSRKRLFIFGINPGRFGGGLTGISFTDPLALREKCGIVNNLGDRKELSSKFIYNVINEFGGVKDFFSKIYLTALYPFAITKNGKNYNYYDERSLAENLKPEIIKTIKSQIEFGARKDLVVVLGKKNADYFSNINNDFNFFEKIIALEHPRYIMQYKLKKINVYLKKYLDAISN